MSYKRCNQCKKRLKDSSIKLFCDELCEKTYNNAIDVFCKTCGDFIGKSSIIKNKLYCSNLCHNENQKKSNIIVRTCIFCNNNFSVKKSSKRHKLCSVECEKLYAKTEKRNSLRMDTLVVNNMEKHNVKYVTELKSVIEKTKKTKLEKYGTSNYNNIEKTNETKLEKYGTSNYNNIEKTKKTKLEKYGTATYNNINKSNETKLEKYGTLDFSDKANETKLEKYGTLDFSEKAKKTISLKYGSWKSVLLKRSYIRLKEKYKNVVNFLFDELEYVGSIGYKKYKFQCKSCESLFEDHMSNGMFPVCRICNPTTNNYSIEEKEVLDFVKSICSDTIIENDRTSLNGLELDIYIPSKKLAIEFNGLYWHSELSGNKDKNYHLNKTELCNKIGIQLIHIFDQEWKIKKDIIKSVLISKLNGNKKIYARNCEIKEIDYSISSDFLLENHLQGDDVSSIRLGLFYQENLISVMTFVKSRFDKKFQFELSRYANKLNINVIGGASKMFSYFIKKYNPESIVSYCNRRFFTGNVYVKIGMNFDSYTPPSYFYFHSNDRTILNRLQFQKHKLKNVIRNFNPAISEWENMKNNNYDRIWDCGNMKYIWNKVTIN